MIPEEKHEMKCRFYENEYPHEEDLCVGMVTQVEDNACYVELLEYAGKIGMITPNEYTRSMQKSIHKAVKVGKEEVVRIVKVDKEKGYIDLSKKKVHPNQQMETFDKFAKAKTIHSIMRTLSQNLKIKIEEFYRKIAWPLYKQPNTSPLQIFKQCLVDQKRIDFLELDELVKSKLFAEIRRRFQPPRIKIIAIFEISINDFEGVNLIKEALNVGLKKSKKDFELSITILGAPAYLVSLETDKKQEGIALLNQALADIKAFMLEKSGTYKTKEEPKVVGDKNAHLYELYKNEEEKAQDNASSDNASDMGEASDQQQK